MKITVIGGGSTYTPELVNGFLSQAVNVPLTELWLMDIDETRLEIVGGFAGRMVAAHGSPFRVILSSDQREAIRGANYVITQLRVGQMPARVRDEYLGKRHGLIGQETTGIGGMAKALRTIPVVLDIATDMREVAPGALLLNFTNPSGLVTEALSRYAADVPAVGVCNVGITTNMTISGPGTGNLAISGADKYRIFNVTSPVTTTLSPRRLSWIRSGGPSFPNLAALSLNS
jgi:6-phospho-beta-glucosidase